MVKVKRGYVFGAFICTTVAAALSIASISTDYWVEADLKPTESGKDYTSSVRYGLFGGVLTLGTIAGKTAFEITMTCLVGENACAMLCRDTQEEREEELQQLVNGEEVREFKCNNYVRKMYSFNLPVINPRATAKDKTFINAGGYISTILFLSLSIVLGVCSACLLMWNVIGNPVQTIFSIYTIYYYVGIAAGLVLLPIIIWGAMFAAIIVENANLLMTLNGQLDYIGNPILHFSYWLNLGSLVMYMTGLGLLITRKYQMDNENIIMTAINAGNPVIF